MKNIDAILHCCCQLLQAREKLQALGLSLRIREQITSQEAIEVALDASTDTRIDWTLNIHEHKLYFMSVFIL